MRDTRLRARLCTAAILNWLGCFFSGSHVLGDDWPQWRGPTRDGVWRETGLIDRFTRDRLPHKWRVEIGGGYAGPTVAEGRVRPETAALLRAHLGTKPLAAPAFDLPRRFRLVDMLRADLTDARETWLKEAQTDQERVERERSDFLRYRDQSGHVADFHALRHTFISNLARGGVHPKLAHSLARHSTITLTMDRYTHTVLGEQIDALAALPDLSAPVQ